MSPKAETEDRPSRSDLLKLPRQSCKKALSSVSPGQGSLTREGQGLRRERNACQPGRRQRDRAPPKSLLSPKSTWPPWDLINLNFDIFK